MFTAGALLGLMAIPTIFTLSEDALNNVPAAFSEASDALGASKLQTIFRPQVELRWQTRPGRKGTKAHSCWHVQSTFYSDIQ